MNRDRLVAKWPTGHNAGVAYFSARYPFSSQGLAHRPTSVRDSLASM